MSSGVGVFGLLGQRYVAASLKQMDLEIQWSKGKKIWRISDDHISYCLDDLILSEKKLE